MAHRFEFSVVGVIVANNKDDVAEECQRAISAARRWKIKNRSIF